MADSVASFPDIADVQQKLPVGNGESGVVTSVVPIIPISAIAVTTPTMDYNLSISNVGADGMFNVTGITRPFSNNLKSLGGQWNKEFFCWKFESKYKEHVEDLIKSITSGKVQPEKMSTYKYKNKKNFVTPIPNSNRLPSSSGSTNFSSVSPLSVPSGSIAANLPTLPNKDSDNFQTITYSNVYVPKAGMFANIKMGENTERFQVTKVGTTGTNVDHAYINTPNGTSELIVVKGHWKVNGLMEYHNVYFMKNK